jgi:hypothetical protein
MNGIKPFARKSEIVVQESNGETLVYDLRIDKAICLNETSTLIWESCDGTKTPAQIAENLEKKFGNKVEEDLVWFALNQLKEENLLDNKEIPNRFNGISRREVIKRVGFASMIALPVIASITAPPVYAQASCPSPAGSKQAGDACTANCECGQGLVCNATLNTCQPI